MGRLRREQEEKEREEAKTERRLQLVQAKFANERLQLEREKAELEKKIQLERENESNQPSTSRSQEKLLDEITKLQKTIRALEKEKECKICMDNQVEVVFIPCFHVECCAICAKEVRECPISRRKIGSINPVFTG